MWRKDNKTKGHKCVSLIFFVLLDRMGKGVLERIIIRLKKNNKTDAK
jgi:hypothetical protein